MKKLFNANDWRELKKETEKRKRAGQKLVFTNGCFDILHAGHEALLAFAAEQGGQVVVGLNSDASVRRLKGDGRPVNKAKKRAKALLDTGFVDIVAIYENDTPQEITDHLEPDILIKGDDYHFDTTVGAPEVRARGGKVLFFKKVPGLSTSGILSEKNK